MPERNPYFTGRELLLDQIQQALAQRGRAALSGLGGAGKTQTAAEYAHRHWSEYRDVLWASAASEEILVSSYVAIAESLNLPEHTDKDQIRAVKAVRHWFLGQSGWLLVLDNADDIAMARAFIPQNNGHVILTTRARAMGGVARMVEVKKMEVGEGALLLLRRAGIVAEDAPLSAASSSDGAAAQEISEQLLDGLPLALDQAGAYLEETGCGLREYINLYRKHGRELLKRRGELYSGHPDPVATTWSLSFEKVAKANAAAADLLRFCAFLDPDQIPEELFAAGAAELGPVLGAASDAVALNGAISETLKYSLVQRDTSTKTLEIHRLVQNVLRQEMDGSLQRIWAERTVRAVNLAFPAVEFSTWPACERLLPQANVCAQWISEFDLQFEEAGQLLNAAGFYLYERARYNKAKPLYQRALAIREQALGPEHPDVATSLNNLALLYSNQGQYAEAEPLYQRALTILEKALGPEHPNVATCMENYAELLIKTGRTESAEQFQHRAAEIRAK